MSRTPSCAHRSLGEESGFVAGAEALILGVLVFVFGTLVVLNGWRVIDAKFATNAAAREAVRAIVESPGGLGDGALEARALAAAHLAVGAHGYDGAAVAIIAEGPPAQGRCDAVRLRAELDVRGTIVPGMPSRGTYTVASTHEEIIDPFRSGLHGEADCGF